MANRSHVEEKHRRLSEYTEGSKSDGELKVIHGRRKRRKRHLFLHILLRLLLVAIIIAGGIEIYKNWDTLAPESLVVWVNEKLSGSKGDGFPVEITGSSVSNMSMTDEGLALLTDTNYILYNNNGGELVRRQHGFSKPILKTKGKWALIAEAGGSRVRVETLASTSVEMTVNTHIIEAAVDRNGDFALATDSSQGYTSEVVVYDKHKKEIYHWYSSDLTVTNLALSPDGKSIAVVGVAADNGAMQSSILVFDMDKKDPVAQYQDTDLMLCSVGYFPNGTLTAIGDKALWVVNESGSIQQKTSYDDHTLIGYTMGDNSVSAVLRNYGNSEGGTLLTVNPTGDKAYSTAYEGTYRSVAPCNTGVLLLTSEHLYRMSTTGTPAVTDVVQDGRLVCSWGNKAIILGLTKLSECDIPTT